MTTTKTILLSMLFILLCGCQPQNTSFTNEDKSFISAKLDTLMDEYVAASLAQDMDATKAFFTLDYFNYPEYGVTQDRDATMQMFIDMNKNYTLERMQYMMDERFIHESMTYELGGFELMWVTLDKSDTLYGVNRCFTVFKKDENEDWKLHRWLGQQG